MTSKELRTKFLEFYEKRGHVIVPSSSLIPDDPSVLITTAGMQQFKPYYTGAADPLTSIHPSLGKTLGSKNAVSAQKSFRTSDIDEVGDVNHLTFFEMLGNFSFGGYFKEEAIRSAYDFFKEIGVPIHYVTVFEGDEKIPKDVESRKIWEELGVVDIREATRGDNFWGPTGKEGPCGPTTEIYVNSTEVWNIVFNEYYCKPDGVFEKLATPGVDTGMGLERLAMVSQGKNHLFETDLFAFLMELTPDSIDDRTQRIIADHMRAVVFLLADGVRPANKEAGYVLRRLIRRVAVYEHLMHEKVFSMESLIPAIQEKFGEVYPEIQNPDIITEFKKEKEKFEITLVQGLKELDKKEQIDAKSAFYLYETFGLPFEIIKEVGGIRAGNLLEQDFEQEFEKHREISRAGREKKFGGHGLILDTGELKAATKEEVEIVTRLHTATHLLQTALQKILGESVHQDGSDITAERTRFDFTFDRKLTPEELLRVEDMVNQAIQSDLQVTFEEMSYKDAVATGALYFKRQKYPAQVKVYSMTDSHSKEVFSREFCGGPHVERTREIGKFRIKKQESVSAGVRRIRGVVE